MPTETAPLFTPFTLGSMEIKNLSGKFMLDCIAFEA